MKERHKVVPAVIFMLEREGRMLLIKRHNTGHFDDIWCLPGGHIEAGEHALQALAREVREELGVTINPEDAQLMALHNYQRRDDQEGLNFYFRVTTWQGEPVNNEPANCSAIGWFAPQQLPADTMPEVHEVISKLPAHFFLPGHYQPRLGQGA